MHIERLITMANDIAAFFHGAVEPDEAAQSVATHLKRYWDPRMRKQIMEHHRAGGAGLNELANKGVELLAKS